jgi:hypothetical protein
MLRRTAATCLLAVMALAHAGVAAPGFPRIANLWGYGPTALAAEYERLARYDLLVMGGGPPATWRVFARELPQAIFDVAPAVLLDWRAGQASDGLRVDPVSQTTASGLRGTQGDPNAGWARLFGTDPAGVHFAPGHVFRIEADVEILAKPSGTLQFNLRSSRGGWEQHDKGVTQNPAASGQTWHLDVTVVPDEFDDYAAEWHLNGAGDVCLTKLRITQIDQCYYRRDSAGGIAVLNAVPRPATIDLKGEFTRLRDDAAPAWVVEVDDAQPGFSCQGAWERVAGEVHASGDGYRQADALRVESARRYNDGGRVTQLTLGPLDGVVLLRP